MTLGGQTTAGVDGSAGADAIIGSDSGDRLMGGDGSGTLTGGLGADVLYGQGGADTFKTSQDSPAAGGSDVIGDFTTGTDKIDLQALETNGAFTFIGTAGFDSHHPAGKVRYVVKHGPAIVQVDVDGDRHADLAIHLDHRVFVPERLRGVTRLTSVSNTEADARLD